MESIWRKQRPPSADLVLVTQTGLSQRKFKNQETRTKDIRIFGSGSQDLKGLRPGPRSGLVRKETDYLLLAQEEIFSPRWGAHMSSAFPPFAKHTVTCLFFATVLCLTPSDWSNISERHLMPVEKADAAPFAVVGLTPSTRRCSMTGASMLGKLLTESKATLTIRVRRPSQAGTKREPL